MRAATSPSLATFAVAACLLVGATSPLLAAQMVNVTLVGERGGKMSIELDKTEVPAGEVAFHVVNAAKNTPHEMIVIQAASPDQTFAVDASTSKIDEDALTSMGEVSGLKAGETGDLTVALAPGSYVLLCNLKGHYAAGMAAEFTVAAAAS